MKRLKSLIIVLILTSLFACEPPVTFNKPQPPGKSNLSNFPNRLQGQFLSLADSSVLSINDKFIQRIYDFDYKVNKDELDSNLILVGDTIIDKETNEKTLIKREGDSLITHIHYVNTLFQMNYDNVVRKFKGYYFLSTRYNKTSWEVKKVKFSRGKLAISSISTENDIENLKEITDAKQDTISRHKFTTSKRQFRKFIRKGGFTDNEVFIRQE